MQMKDLRRGTECTFLRLGPDGCECVGDHGDKKVNEPEIKYNDGCDEEQAGHEELGINHAVHDISPLKKYLVEHLTIGITISKTYPIGTRDDDNLQCREIDGIETFNVVLGI